MDALNDYLHASRSSSIDLKEVKKLVQQAASERLEQANATAKTEEDERRKTSLRERRRRQRSKAKARAKSDDARKLASGDRVVTRFMIRQAIAGKAPSDPEIRERLYKDLSLLRCCQCDSLKHVSLFRSRRSSACLECMATKTKSERILAEFVMSSLRDIRKRARRKKRDYEISISRDWVIRRWHDLGGKCQLCGEGMTLSRYSQTPEESRSKTFHTIPLNLSIDQREPGKGYTPQNAQLTHVRCNLMKMDIEMDEFVSTCARIVAFQRPSSEKGAQTEQN